jgi:DNA-directed RNA polymerase subunit beta'
MAAADDLFFSHDDFDAISVCLASPEKILSWSHGEVKKPETINYRSQRPEREGLFCEKIFGPSKNWECYCGKYRKIKYRGITCEKCGVEITRKSVRRERMGHIKLAVPVTHTWFLRSVPSQIGLLLDVSSKALEQVIIFAAYIVKEVREEQRQEELKKMEAEWKKLDAEIKEEFETDRSKLELKKKEAKTKKETMAIEKELTELAESSAAKVDELKEQFDELRKALEGIEPKQILSEAEYVNLRHHFGHVFEAGDGAEALFEIIQGLDLKAIENQLHEEVKVQTSLKLQKSLKRLKLISSLRKNKIDPRWMFLSVVPVLPPDLRPMVPLDGSRYATADMNDLYRRVINRNNRLKRLISIGAPEVITRNEKRMLQEAVDALINNAPRGGRAALNAGSKRRYKSLTDILKGKQGRFRQNLLGKRVDYSGRSVIVVNPDLKLEECGLPKKMALELFKPFVLSKIIQRELASNLKQAERVFARGSKEVWDLLAEAVKDRAVLLNRAPTLHRLGIQAFIPKLVDGNAIQIHPLVCEAFNADFDGDQMAVHLPLSAAAQKEAHELMLARKNLIKPGSGATITVPRQDMVLGLYLLTATKEGAKGEGSIFASAEEARLAHVFGKLEKEALVKIRINSELVETTLGRVEFNKALPEGFPFVNEQINKKAIKKIFMEVLEKFGTDALADLTDSTKQISFDAVTRSGLSMGLLEISPPEKKTAALVEAQEKVEKIHRQFRHGLLTDEERYSATISAWQKSKNAVADAVKESFPRDNAIFSMIDSGARGSWGEVTQLLGMKGLVVSPTGRTIELPIKSSFFEGFSILEYFTGCHAGRKGLADRALGTAKAGYLTRRLVDSVQDILVREEDCGTTQFLTITRKESEAAHLSLADRIYGRHAAADISAGKKKLAKKGEMITLGKAREIDEAGVEEVSIWSPTTCETVNGVCQKCYGMDLTTANLVEMGTPVGIIAAQSLGEPGTQLTMDSIHRGGINEASDITSGLPRIEELFEARAPKQEAVMAPFAGTVKIDDADNGTFIARVIPSEAVEREIRISDIFEPTVSTGDEVKAKQTVARVADRSSRSTIRSSYTGKVVAVTKDHIVIELPRESAFEAPVAFRTDLLVEDGEKVKSGQQLTIGHLDPRKLFEATDLATVQKHIILEAQKVFAGQGIGLQDKHFEVITRQMLSKVRVLEPGGSKLLSGETHSRQDILNINDELKKKKKSPVAHEQLILGLARVALSTESWLSAASFQDTVKVLIAAATTHAIDHLRGIKENVIIGRLIPAGKSFQAQQAGK